MPARIEIKGTSEFRRTAARLKAAGNGQLAREMAKKMRHAVKPAVDEAQRSVRALSARASSGGGGQARREYALSRARKRNEAAKKKAYAGRGLRDSTARAVSTQVRSTARSASVRVRVDSKKLPPDQRKLPRHMNRGQWRHPVFGDRGAWVTQTVSRDQWFDDPMRRNAPRVRNSAGEAVKEIQQKIVR